MKDWLSGLNPEQREAVSHDHGPLLILAGAGSGKTTVLVSRTGRLIEAGLTSPERICVLTFTNKAALELKHRVSRKLGDVAGAVWSGTFHGFGLQFLKEHYRLAGLPKKFGIIDGGDSEAIVKDLLRDHRDFEKAQLNVTKVLYNISLIRQTGKDNKFDDTPESAAGVLLAPKYVKRLKHLGVVDFEELLLQPLRLLQEHESLRKQMQARYDFVMVDEFQDTNLIQMRLIDELINAQKNVAVVGDDDQSIYGWRGAEIQNILGFPNRYSNCNVIRLERNYRSTSKILDLANAIIASNKTRHAKVLKPNLDNQGVLPEVFVFENEDDEIDQVVRELSHIRKQGYKWRDMAILYRSNSQGGLMEGGLRRSQIPYQLTGGTALFDRKEAKDVLAFIRSCLHPSEVSFRRIVNLPSRGVGERTLEHIESMPGPDAFHIKAKKWAELYPDEASAQAIITLFRFLARLRSELVESPESAESVLESQLRELGYRDYVNQSYRSPGAADARWLSVTILGRILDGMFNRHGRSFDTLEMCVDCMELRDPVADPDKENSDEVQMMTLHACKGLEFPVVILLGLEEELLPHARLGSNVDEERRLFYVGVTRAQKQLIITRVRERKRYGRVQPVAPSRFLVELDKKLFTEVIGGRPLASGERESMLKDLYKRLDKKISDRN